MFREAGLTTVIINAETPERSDMWTRAGESGSRVLLLSPEQLISKRLEKLVNDSGFRRRVCLLSVDEVHLLDTWGKSFRKAYLQIEFMRARFESNLVMIAMTATLLPGEQTERICKFVGLKSRYHKVHRSNRRPEIQLLFRVLSHGIESWESTFDGSLTICDKRRSSSSAQASEMASVSSPTFGNNSVPQSPFDVSRSGCTMRSTGKITTSRHGSSCENLMVVESLSRLIS